MVYNFSCNKKLEREMKLQSHIVKIEIFLRLWRMGNLTMKETLYKNLSFPLRISSVNVTKSVGSYEYGHIY